MKQYEISAPVRTFTGEAVGVQFRNGTGYVNDGSDDGRAALAYFQRSAYGIREVENGDAPIVVEPPADPNPDGVTGGSIAQTGALAEGPFDPADHNAAEVQAHLDGADAAEAERVLDAEAVGKNRSGIVRQREAVLASKQPAPADDTTDSKGADQ
ncbi:hypothetical protein [Streptomyces sp. NPDC051577]|uniref:hypothetical protein n=1 Tax=Streptomyces sp. NPDC051577 TaxID=3155166 RepID=UPI003412DC5B